MVVQRKSRNASRQLEAMIAGYLPARPKRRAGNARHEATLGNDPHAVAPFLAALVRFGEYQAAIA